MQKEERQVQNAEKDQKNALPAVRLLPCGGTRHRDRGKNKKENQEQYWGERSEVPFLFEDGDVVGFIGDSITHVEYTGISYQEFIYNYYITRYPDWELEFRNLGTASYMAADAVKLFGGSAQVTDPAMQGINKAVIMFGMNEALHDWSAERYIQSINQLVKQLNGWGIENQDIILVAPTPYDQTRSSNYTENGEQKEETDDLLSEYTGELKILSDELGTHYIDLHTPMLWVTDLVQDKIPDDTLTVTDNVHPNAMGSTLAGFFFLYQQGAEKQVAEVLISEDGSLSAERADVGNLKKKGERYLRFKYRPESLPMAVSYEFHEATQYFEVIDAISEEKLTVEGLRPETQYTVYMDYYPLRVCTGKELASGINLTDLDLNPGQQAAKQIEVLNQKWQMVSADYRSLVRSAVKGITEVSQQEIDAAYEQKSLEMKALRDEMYGIARKAVKKTHTVEIVSEGYQVWMERRIWAVGALLIAVLLGSGFLAIRQIRKKAQKKAQK